MEGDLRYVLGTGARMSELASGTVALVLTSPPYFPESVAATLSGPLGADTDLMELEELILELALALRPVFEECARVLVPGGRLIVQTRDVRLRHQLVPVAEVHRRSIEAIGLRLFTRHLWRPPVTTLGRRNMARSLLASHGPLPPDPEVFMVFFKSGAVQPGVPTAEDIELLSADVLLNPRGRLPAPHPWQSPLPVVTALIRSHTQVDDLVVDPFMGGGTVLWAAQRLGRRGWGCDTDPEALRLAQRNLGPST